MTQNAVIPADFLNLFGSYLTGISAHAIFAAKFSLVHFCPALAPSLAGSTIKHNNSTIRNEAKYFIMAYPALAPCSAIIPAHHKIDTKIPLVHPREC